MSFAMGDWAAVPGMQAARLASENAFLWFRGASAIYQGGILILSSSLDGGNTGLTTQLRAGLLMGKITSSGKYTQWTPTATDGSQFVQGVLAYPVAMLDINGAAADRVSVLCVGGPVKNGSLYSGASPYTIDQMARSQMRGRFIFDDDYYGNQGWPAKLEAAKVADYQLTVADSNSLFTNTASTTAVSFTLPSIANGLNYSFLVVADQTLTVVSTEGDNIVTHNDASADTVAFASPGDRIGGALKVFTNAAGTKWYVYSDSLNAITIAT